MAGKALHEPILLIEILSPIEPCRNLAQRLGLHDNSDAARNSGDPDCRRSESICCAAGTTANGPTGRSRSPPERSRLSSIDLSLPVAALYRGTGMA